MNITFLIGNGFDVGLGLKSRFKDFFPIYKILSENKSEEIKKFSEDINEDLDTWSDFESALGEYTTQFSKKSKAVFLKRLEDFELEFIKYLKGQEENLLLHNKIGLDFKESLANYYSTKVLHPESSLKIDKVYVNYANQSRIYNFINFNYTNLLEKCISKIPQNIVSKHKYNEREINDKIGKIIHIHGTYGLYPIIGVNDSSQIKNKELAFDPRFCRYLVKPTLNEALGQGNDAIATELINKSSIICVYGMSLGSTDKKWWDCILTWLYSHAERQLVIFVYDELFSTDTSLGFIAKQNELIDRLNSFNLNKSFNVEKLRHRIHLAIQKNIFSFQAVNLYDEAIKSLSDKSIEESA